MAGLGKNFKSGALSFLGREAGQRRRAWLNSLDDSINRGLQYWTGPAAGQIGGLANAVAAFSDAGDFGEAAEASQNLWNNPSVSALGRYATAGAALALPIASARMMNEGVDVMGDAIRSGREDLANFLAREDGTIGRNEIFDSADEVERILREKFGDDITIRHTKHPTSYGNSAYLEVNSTDGKFYTRTGRRLSDHDVGEARRGTDEYSTVTHPDAKDVAAKMAREIEQGWSKTVIDLLKKGRASEVTDDMLSKADDAYLYNNYDLPMDVQSRMARREEMELGGNWFRGVSGTHPPKEYQNWTNDPREAAGYAAGGALTNTGENANIIPAVMRRGGVRDAMDDVYEAFDNDFDVDDMVRGGLAGDDAKYAEFLHPPFSGDEEQLVRVVKDPANIRSKFARFDPRLKHLRNLSAGLAPFAIGAAATYGTQQDNGLSKYSNFRGNQ